MLSHTKPSLNWGLAVGASTGDMYQVEGEGTPSPRQGGRPGNLVVQVCSYYLLCICWMCTWWLGQALDATVVLRDSQAGNDGLVAGLPTLLYGVCGNWSTDA